jgi:hypothetical protein
VKNDVNVASKEISKKSMKTKNFVVVILKVNDKIPRSGSVSQRYGSANPDPYQNTADT